MEGHRPDCQDKMVRWQFSSNGEASSTCALLRYHWQQRGGLGRELVWQQETEAKEETALCIAAIMVKRTGNTVRATERAGRSFLEGNRSALVAPEYERGGRVDVASKLATPCGEDVQVGVCIAVRASQGSVEGPREGSSRKARELSQPPGHQGQSAARSASPDRW